jgi:hypothetical protein
MAAGCGINGRVGQRGDRDMNRIYQGRVTKVEIFRSVDR